ncbi:hypothetical protein QQF73_01255 [Marinobacter sp. M216]|uniref:Uncharacterized protein n=1 Tax=Marinobacter albus TaxID=3030833 RepID=A0ABT7H885_9GAMM|nr:MULTISPECIES: hypothetical protein [unclassified Marinobacter]MBW7471488.1 hypothetical protein [Marinobacter sp. F4218]MDK9556234.1 hypothetical protein [Marinobacter sp. M216]
MSIQIDPHQRRWWLGMGDLLAQGASHSALKLERVHLAIADETFGLLERVPVARPWSRLVRVSHRGISRVSYRSVSLAAAGLGFAIAALSPDPDPDQAVDRDQEA